MLAFDRRLELPGIALERERAEQLLLELRGQRSGGLTAVVEFTIEGAQLDASSETGATPVGALLARLDQVTIRTSEGREVARYEADAFPLARPAETVLAAAAAPQSQPRYGEPVFVDERAVASGVLHTALGWGEPARAPRPDLGRRDLDVPATVLEADVWAANGVTVAVLRLAAARTAVADRPASQGIKF